MAERVSNVFRLDDGAPGIMRRISEKRKEQVMDEARREQIMEQRERLNDELADAESESIFDAGARRERAAIMAEIVRFREKFAKILDNRRGDMGHTCYSARFHFCEQLEAIIRARGKEQA